MSNGNEPAYPVPNSANVSGQEGMSKREAFAMAAMQGVLSNTETLKQFDRVKGMTADMLPLCYGMYAVSLADALLAALAKEPK